MTLSPSALNLLLTCSYAYKLKYIDKVEQKFSINTLSGLAFHFLISNYLKTGISEFETYWKKFCNLNPETMILLPVELENIKTNVMNMLKLYEPFATNLSVKYSEEGFKKEINGVDFFGIIDVITENSVIDFKTTNRIPSSITNSNLLQITIYSLMTEIDNIEIHYISNKRVVVYKTVLTQELKNKFFMLVDSVKDILAKEVFIPNGLLHPFACNYCSFSDKCCFTNKASN